MKNLTKKDLLRICKEISDKEGRRPKLKDLEKKGITWSIVKKLFVNFTKLLLACGFISNRRKRNMTDDEFKKYLRQIKTIGASNCPSLKKQGTPCFKRCTCWITGRYYLNNMNRQSIIYKGKTMRLYQVSQLLFNGSLPLKPRVDVSHKCDNSQCFNPDHLEILTHQKNIQDSVKRGRHHSGSNRRKYHKLANPYNFSELLNYVKSQCTVSILNEWLWNGKTNHGYPVITFKRKPYRLHRLILANKLRIPYEKIKIARHVMPDGSEGQRHDLNPDHLRDGTRSENSTDSKNKWNLSEEDHTTIFRELDKTKFIKRGDASVFDLKMAKKFKVSAGTIQNIRLGNTYKVYLKDISDKQIRRANSGKPVVQLDLNGNFICRYDTAAEAARKINGNRRSITSVCRGESKTSGGFVWVFEDQYKRIR